MKTYFIHTFGCQMNVHESEIIAGILEKRGYLPGKTAEEADVVVFNTCTIRETADKKIEAHIGRMKPLKASNRDKIIIVCGCMTQHNNTKLFQKFPFIDIIFGTHNLAVFGEMFDEFMREKKHIIKIEDKLRPLNKSFEIMRSRGTNAWVNITHGCNNFCSYCIVPYVRGREISRETEDIIFEVRSLISQGYKQITLLGQNVNSYGNDIEDEKVSFANLLRKLDEIPGKFRIRFMTSHPKDLSDEVIETIAKSKHICHGIHLPVQSGSSDILARMNRKYTRSNYLSLVSRIKKRIPDAELTTDIIVGFPNESEKDFEDTLSLIREVRFQQIYAFIYSKRSGTAAEKMEDKVSAETKKKRLANLIEVQRGIASEIAKTYVGKTFEVLVEGTITKNGKTHFVGVTDSNKNINFVSDAGAKSLIGQFVNVNVTSSKLSVLYGKQI